MPIAHSERCLEEDETDSDSIVSRIVPNPWKGARTHLGVGGDPSSEQCAGPCISLYLSIAPIHTCSLAMERQREGCALASCVGGIGEPQAGGTARVPSGDEKQVNRSAV